jgi:hypothetical protein
MSDQRGRGSVDETERRDEEGHRSDELHFEVLVRGGNGDGGVE